MEWINAVLRSTATEADFLYVSKRWESLDNKLASAMFKAAHGDAGRVLLKKQKELAKQNKQLKGRHAFWLVVDFFRPTEEGLGILDLSDLALVKMKGDENMQKFKEFVNDWLKNE